MIVVFWRQREPSDGWIRSEMKEFEANQMMDALKFAEALRKRRKEGEQISHVCMQSELPEAVGEAGVSDKLPEDYSWRKRREDPNTFGRKPTGDDVEVDLSGE